MEKEILNAKIEALNRLNGRIVNIYNDLDNKFLQCSEFMRVFDAIASEIREYNIDMSELEGNERKF